MIASGTLLIERDARRPPFFHLREDEHPNGWMPVTHDLGHRELEKALWNGGWTFFYMASPIRKRAFGFDRPRTLDAALGRVIAMAKEQGCNCIEVDGVETRSFLGLPYVDVSAHARHIQKGSFFIRQ